MQLESVKQAAQVKADAAERLRTIKVRLATIGNDDTTSHVTVVG
jgi:hypothetical protein